MVFLTKLAFKNLARHRKRTFITASIIAAAIFFYIMFDSLLLGMNEIAYRNIINYESGHIQVADINYWEEKEKLPLNNLIIPGEKLKEIIISAEGFKAMSPELNFRARLNNGQNELPVIGKGIKPEQYKNVFTLEEQFVEGKMFTSGEFKAIMGKKLADLMKLKNGDYITLLVRDKNDTFNTIEAQISGLVHTANPNVNQNIVYVPLDIARQTLRVDNKVSQIIIRLNNKNQAPGIDSKLTEKLKKYKNTLGVYSWNELEAITFMKAKQSSNKFILAIILLIAAIAIINTVILAALERMDEIGMMKAMGLRVKEIIFTFVLESTGIGILGGIIGSILGAIGVGFLVNYGLDFSGIIDFELSSFGVPVLGLKYYGAWNPKSFFIVSGFGVIVSLLASIWPAYWAAMKDPVQSIYNR